MLSRRFSLRLVFVLVTLACTFVWALTSPNVATCLLTVFITCLTAAIKGRSTVRGSVYYGGFAGAASALVLILGNWFAFLCGYYFHKAPWPYFEDGLFVEVFIYPIVHSITYMPIGAVIGMLTGIFVNWWFGKVAGWTLVV